MISQHSKHQTQDIDISGMEYFNLAIQDAYLFETQTKGLSFSWWNSQDGNPTSKRIYHALVNQQWSFLFSDAYLEFLPPDHSLYLVYVPSLKHTTCKNFQFFHHVVDHPHYAESKNQRRVQWDSIGPLVAAT